MLQVNATEFRQRIDELANGKDHNMLFAYLRTTGLVIPARGGQLDIADTCFDTVKYTVSDVEEGDVVWVANQGLLLVIDKTPKVNNDGHHFRALRVTSNGVDTGYRILGDLRSIIIDDHDTFKIRHTSFDVAEIDRISYERYTLYARISQINDQLSQMKENKNG